MLLIQCIAFYFHIFHGALKLFVSQVYYLILFGLFFVFNKFLLLLLGEFFELCILCLCCLFSLSLFRQSCAQLFHFFIKFKSLFFQSFNLLFKTNLLTIVLCLHLFEFLLNFYKISVSSNFSYNQILLGLSFHLFYLCLFLFQQNFNLLHFFFQGGNFVCLEFQFFLKNLNSFISIVDGTGPFEVILLHANPSLKGKLILAFSL